MFDKRDDEIFLKIYGQDIMIIYYFYFCRHYSNISIYNFIIVVKECDLITIIMSKYL